MTATRILLAAIHISLEEILREAAATLSPLAAVLISLEVLETLQGYNFLVFKVGTKSQTGGVQVLYIRSDFQYRPLQVVSCQL